MTSDVSTDLTYCERWNRRQRAPIHPLTEEQARARHEAGELYTVVLPGGPFPTLVELFLADGYAGVRFLEEHGRDALAYSFTLTDDRLFLSQVDLNTVSDDDRVVESEMTLIKPDGTVQVRHFDNVAGTVQTLPPTSGNDVSAMWEDVPAFGDYASLARRER